MTFEIKGGARALNSADDKVDVSDRAARLVGHVVSDNGSVVDVQDRAARLVGHVVSDNGSVVDVQDRAARAAGKVGIQVAGLDVSGGNPVPTAAAVTKADDVASVPSAARTVTGDSGDIDVSTIKSLSLWLNISAVSGTVPTLVVDIMSKDPISGQLTRISGIASQNAAGQNRLPAITSLGGVIRIKWTITGTTPSFTFSAALQKET